MAKLVLIYEDTEDKKDFKFDIKIIEQSEEEKKEGILTNASMAAFLTGYVIQQGHLDQFKEEFIKFTRDEANRIHLEEQKAN